MPVSSRQVDRTIRLDAPSYANMPKVECRIFELLDQKTAYFQQYNMENVHPYNFLLLESLSEHEDDPNNIYHALVRLSDVEENGRNRMIYLYPFMFIENDRVIVKISIIRPALNEGEAHIRDAERMSMRALELSLPVLDRIVQYRKTKPLQIPSEEPESLIVKNKASTENQGAPAVMGLHPDALAFETELKGLLNTGFSLKQSTSKKKGTGAPVPAGDSDDKAMHIKPVPIPHAIDDWIHYLKKSGYLFEVTDDYHIVKMTGKDLSDEICKYILIYKEALKNVVLPRMHNEIRKTKTHDYNEAYKNWNAFIKKEEESQDNLVEEAKLLISVFEAASLNPIHQEAIGFSLKKIQRCIYLLERFIKLESEESNSDTNQLIASLRNQISFNSQQKKLLTTINLNHEITKIGISPSDEGIDYLKDIFEQVSESFAFYTESGVFDEIRHYEKIHLVDSGYLLGVIANLAQLASRNRNYVPDYEIAKKIQKKIDNDIRIHPELNAKLSEEEVKEAKRIIAELDAQILKLRDKSLKTDKKEKKASRYDWSKGLSFSAIYFAVTLAFSLIISYEFMAILLVYPFFFMFFFKNTEKEDGSSKKSATKHKAAQPTANAVLNYFENYFYADKRGPCISRISDSNQLDSLLAIDRPKTINQLKQTIPELKGLADASIKKTFHKVFNKNIAKITFRDSDLPKSRDYMNQSGVPFPRNIYIKKNDLSSPLFRQGLAEEIRKVFKNLMPSETDKQEYYRSLINILEVPREYHKYLH